MRKVKLITINCGICGTERKYRPCELRQRKGNACSLRCSNLLRYREESNRKKMSDVAKRNGYGKWMFGKKLSNTTVNKIREANMGHGRHGWKMSNEIRIRMSESRRGDKTNFWKGGVTKINALERTRVEYRLWREEVFRRDNFTCQLCGIRGGKLHADHIKPFALFPELRLELSNGRTLCVPCHKSTPTYLVSGKKLVEAAYGIKVELLRAK